MSELFIVGRMDSKPNPSAEPSTQIPFLANANQVFEPATQTRLLFAF